MFQLDSISVYIFSVPVSFKIALWDIKFSRHCVVVLGIDGVEGYGSGVLYRNRPLAAMRLLREEINPFLETTTFTNLGDLRNQIQQRFVSKAPSLVYALDSALWDIQGKMKSKPVNQLLGTPKRDKIEITEQIFISDSQQTRRELGQILSHGTKHVKIKIGHNPSTDVERVRMVREIAGDDVELGVDINRGYTFQRAVTIGKALKELGVCILEDPLPREDRRLLPKLREEVGIPIMLDSGIQSLQNLREAIELEAIDALNIKLTRVGGLTSALEYADMCKRNGVKISVGCSEDLGPGMASILHLSSIFDDLYSTEGVGPTRLGFDIIDEEFDLESGFLSVPAGHGLGVTFNEERLWNAGQKKHFVIGDAHKPSAAFFIREKFNKWYQRWFTLRCRLQRKVEDMRVGR
jgi:L-alanine-DL-glutamate epimerase-like enolase superfamily enzyme